MIEFDQTRKEIDEIIKDSTERKAQNEQRNRSEELQRRETQRNLEINRGKIRRIVKTELDTINEKVLNNQASVSQWEKMLSKAHNISGPELTGGDLDIYTHRYHYLHQVEFECMRLNIPTVGSIGVYLKTKDGKSEVSSGSLLDLIRDKLNPDRYKVMKFETVQPQVVIVRGFEEIPTDEKVGASKYRDITLSNSTEDVRNELRKQVLEEIQNLYKHKYR